MTHVEATQLILIADPSPDDVVILQHLLLRDDPRRYRVLVAQTGEACIQLCQDKTPSVILLNYALPDMDCLEVISTLIDLPLGSRPSTIVLTEKGDDALAIDAIAAGAQDYLTKDRLTPELLHQTIRIAREKQRLRDDLQESEARYRLFFESSPTPAWVVAPDLAVILEVNDAAISQYGSTRDEFLSMTIPSLRRENHEPRVAEQIQAALTATNGDRVPAQHLTKTGQILDVELSWRDVTVNGHRRRLAVTYDVTDRVRAAEKEHAALELAEQTARLREEFLTIAAHELKTPLTILRGQSQLNLRRIQHFDTLDRVSIVASFERIEDQTRKLQRLVEQLLDSSTLGSGHIPLALITTDIVAVVTRAVNSAQLRSNGQLITLDAPDTLPGIVDPLRLEHVLSNLLENAIKWGPMDDVIQVQVSRDHASPECVHIVIRDHGRGIPPEYHDHIFERFQRVHSDDHMRGFGLGLTFCRDIVERHHGTIQVESPPGGGTRVQVSLPLNCPAQKSPQT